MDTAQDQLPDDVGVLKSIIIVERLRNKQLEQLVALLQRMQFGKRSEKIAPDQLAPSTSSGGAQRQRDWPC
jgi:transposase